MSVVHPLTSYEVYAAIKRTADARGVAKLSVGGLAKDFGVAEHIVRGRVNLLISVRSLSRVERGLFQVRPFDEDLAVRKSPDRAIDPSQRPMRAQPRRRGCSYVTARALGIEPTTKVLRSRCASFGTTIADLEISVSRVPSLERALA